MQHAQPLGVLPLAAIAGPMQVSHAQVAAAVWPRSAPAHWQRRWVLGARWWEDQPAAAMIGEQLYNFLFTGASSSTA